MQHYKIDTYAKKNLADLNTAVTLYLKLRDQFQNVVLLESNDFNSLENSHSFIGLDPIASFKVHKGTVTSIYPDGKIYSDNPDSSEEVLYQFRKFTELFQVTKQHDFKLTNGFFGHSNFEAVQYFDTHRFEEEKRKNDQPEIHYFLYRYIIAIHHYKDELFLLENVFDQERKGFSDLERIISSQKFSEHPFKLEGEQESNLSDDAFMELVRKGKHHCQVGDVFQIVFSRQFNRKFKGDDFNVYRVLRSINPSPYLFYFDCGDYKIFGSSPEAQMTINDGIATVNPIAGTYKRSGDSSIDLNRAMALSKDPKENAEHIMLVDLARNDLSRHCKEVKVSQLKKIQFFSHVIHLVSRVEGIMDPGASGVQIFADTFPAGTLSGAPKYKAIEPISEYEKTQRGFYGGAIGFIDFNGNMNQAIIIRSFLSKDDCLYWQAGAGIVVNSSEESELQEVNNKLAALQKALIQAEELNSK